MNLLKIFSEKLLDLGKRHKNLVVFNSDFARFSGGEEFSENFSERYFNMGLTEENTVSCASGFAIRGKMPWICGVSSFLTSRAYEQIRNTVCHPNLNVKIVGVGSGFSFSKEGYVWQNFSDIALMRTLPNMKIICPADEIELASALEEMALDFGPTYLSLSLEELPTVHERNYKFKFGKSVILKEGKDLCIFAMGGMVSKALEISKKLQEKGKEATIVNVSSLAPLDEKLIMAAASKVKICISLEEHDINNGLGAIIAQVFSEHNKTLFRIGIENKFGESATRSDLEGKFELTIPKILEKIEPLLLSL